MTESVTEEKEDRWRQDNPTVKALVRFIEAKKKRGRVVTPADLVTWDEAHGGTLFCYESGAEAARQRRLELARKFLSRMTVWLDRVRGIKQPRYQVLPDDLERDKAGRVVARDDATGSLHSLRDIHKDAMARDFVIQKIVSEMKTLAGRLRFWKLSETERRAIITGIEEELLD